MIRRARGGDSPNYLPTGVDEGRPDCFAEMAWQAPGQEVDVVQLVARDRGGMREDDMGSGEHRRSPARSSSVKTCASMRRGRLPKARGVDTVSTP